MKNFKDFITCRDTILLDSQELKTINGGGSYTCYCGHTGGEWEHVERQVEAGSITEALDSMNCGGYGVTCNGN